MQGIARKPTRFIRAISVLWLAALILLGGADKAGAQSAEEELYLDPHHRHGDAHARTPERRGRLGGGVRPGADREPPTRRHARLPERGGGRHHPQTSGRGGQTSLFLRGSESNFTSVMIDGFKLTFPNGSAYDFGHLSPEWVGTAEILKGPQSPLYGSDAASGVMNFIPDIGKPGEAPSFTVRARAAATTRSRRHSS